jgi:MFS family permease
VAQPGSPTPEQRARRQAAYFVGLAWHIGAFLIINAFFWLLDLALGEPGVQWAWWITGAWGLALAFHVLAYLVAGRQLEDRKALQILASGEPGRRRG